MKLYKLLIEQAPHAIAMFDREMNYLVTSGQWLRDYGLTELSIIGRSYYDIFPEVAEDWKKIHSVCLKGAVHQCDETLLVHSDGTVQWINWDIKPWYQEDGSIGGLIMYTADITRQKTLEQQLCIEQDQFRGAFETAAIGMAIVSLEGRWVKVNDSLLRIMGYSKDELDGRTFQDITHPDDLQADLDLVRQLIEGTKDNYQMEKRYYHRNGHIIWILLSVSIVRDTNGKPLHFVSQLTDITETKKIAHLRLAETDKYSSRIAMELHENIAQTIASIKMYLNSSLAAKMYQDRDLHGVDYELSSVLKQIQALTEKITPTTFLHQDLGSLIDTLVTKYRSLHNLRIAIDLDENIKHLSFYGSYHIFRIIEDHLKLAVLRSATGITFTSDDSGTLIIEINDNWQDEQTADAQEQLLLNEIKTRVEIVDGVFRNHTDHYPVKQFSVAIPIRKPSHEAA